MATMKIDQTASFALAVLMSAQPKTKFANGKRTEEQDVSKDGVPKWAVQVTVADRETGSADLLKVTVTSHTAPTEVPIGSPVQFENLGIGIMNGNPFFTASGVLPLTGNGRRSAE